MPRIIEDKIFYEVQQKMEGTKKAPAQAKARIEYLLTTKLFCGHCKEMMRGISGTSRNGKLHQYYTCNGAIKKTCNKQNVKKEYIENLVVEEARKILTDKNILKIAKEVVALCEEDKKGTRVEQLEKELKANERKRTNTINAITECGIDSIRKSLYEEITKLDIAKATIEQEMLIEESSYVKVTEDEIQFFLTKMKTGNVNDIKYKKMLINILIDKIYLYDDRMTIVFTTQNKKVDVDKSLVEKAECSFLVRRAEPYYVNPQSLTT